ncbi:methyltransferase domain-containing protein [Ruania alkalisoli]|uniref:Methyltransferase domain-containing protein n=1 Tax=Ruania alkalisoli TaxID=2779775 RepID=A0A7M1SPF7_9MICO|nr:class I SAM-dependent methyltransferase [Ruania alkalisoli]QOR69321.1 methyltransferase domain-containing protein [Ruania alkalisoli]
MTTIEPTLEQVRGAWDAIAPRFDEFITPAATTNGELALAFADITPGTRLLDVACGSGALAIPAARRGAEVTAVDIAAQMIELLAERARQAGVSVDGRVMDAHALDLPDNSYDVSVSQNGVTMSTQLVRAIGEMVRVTRPGGTVLVAAFGPLPRVEFLRVFFAGVRSAVPGFAGLPTNPPPPPFQVAAPEALAAALTQAGVQEVAVHPVRWEIPVGSAQTLWDEVTSSNPLGAQAVAGLDASQRGEALRVLNGMLRERFDGQPGGVLPALVNVGVGRA